MAQLLEPLACESGRQSPQRMAANPALVNAVVAALAANGTTTARRILAGLVTGTQATIHPQGAATAALKALLQDARRSDEELVFDIITSSCPDPPVNAEPAAIDRDKLRATALVWVKASASESLRLRLAKNNDRARHAVGDIQATVDAAQRGARRERGRSDRPVPQRSIVEPRRTVARASVRGSESPGAAAVAGPRFAGRAPSCFVTPGRWGCGLMPGR